MLIPTHSQWQLQYATGAVCYWCSLLLGLMAAMTWLLNIAWSNSTTSVSQGICVAQNFTISIVPTKIPICPMATVTVWFASDSTLLLLTKPDNLWVATPPPKLY